MNHFAVHQTLIQRCTILQLKKKDPSSKVSSHLEARGQNTFKVLMKNHRCLFSIISVETWAATYSWRLSPFELAQFSQEISLSITSYQPRRQALTLLSPKKTGIPKLSRLWGLSDLVHTSTSYMIRGKFNLLAVVSSSVK